MSLIGLIEIPKGSTYKYELNKETGLLVLDRVIQLHYPENYGFIPNTLSEDGDELDVFVLSEYSLTPLSQVKLDVLGVVEMTDGGVRDEKIICRLEDATHTYDPSFAQTAYFLNNYKKGIVITKLAGKERAFEIIEESRKRYEKK